MHDHQTLLLALLTGPEDREQRLVLDQINADGELVWPQDLARELQ